MPLRRRCNMKQVTPKTLPSRGVLPGIMVLQAVLGWSLYQAYPAEKLRFTRNPYEVGVISSRGETEIGCTIENRSSEAVRIVGAQEQCGRSACFTVTDLPAVVNSHSSTRLTVRVKPGQPGRFLSDVVFYTTCRDQPTVAAWIAGEIRGDDSAPVHGASSVASNSD